MPTHGGMPRHGGITRNRDKPRMITKGYNRVEGWGLGNESSMTYLKIDRSPFYTVVKITNTDRFLMIELL